MPHRQLTLSFRSEQQKIPQRPDTAATTVTARAQSEPSETPAGISQAPPNPAKSKLPDGSSLSWSLLQRQAGCKLSSANTSQIHRLFWHSLSQVKRSHWPLLPFEPMDFEYMAWNWNEIVSRMAFDSLGQLLVCGSAAGDMSVHRAEHLAAPMDELCSQSSRLDPDEGSELAAIVSIHSGHSLDAVSWNTADESWIGVVGRRSSELRLYDLRRCQDHATVTLRTESGFKLGSHSQSGCGLMDLAFFPHTPHIVAAGSLHGEVIIWDSRRGPSPCTVIATLHHGFALQSLQALPDGQMLMGGTRKCRAAMWDLRRGNVSFSARGAQKHSLLGVLNLLDALGEVPELVAETSIPKSALHRLLLDPQDYRFAAFQLTCRWSGRINLLSGEITHLHCPPSLAEADLSYDLPNISQNLGMDFGGPEPVWCAASSFCVADFGGFLALDFSPGQSSSSALKSTATRRTTVKVAVEEPIATLASNPVTGDMIVSTRSGSLLSFS